MFYVVIFIKKRLSKSFIYGIIYSRAGFQCIWTASLYSTLNSFPIFLPEQQQLEGQWENTFSEKSYPSIYQKLQRWSWCILRKKNVQIHETFTIWNTVCILPLPSLLKSWTRSFKRETITAKIVQQLKCPAKRQKIRFTLQMNDLVLFSSKRLRSLFWRYRWPIFGSDVDRKKPEIASKFVCLLSLMIYTDLIEYCTVGDM